jgi:hypothetical protein
MPWGQKQLPFVNNAGVLGLGGSTAPYTKLDVASTGTAADGATYAIAAASAAALGKMLMLAYSSALATGIIQSVDQGVAWKGTTISPAGGSTSIGQGAIATTATEGFVFIPTCAGAPTGVPSPVLNGKAMIYDTTNNKLWVYNGSWRGIVVA